MSDPVPTIVITIALVLLVIWFIYNGIKVVREKENIIVERLGRYSRTLVPGIHFIVPFIDRPKRFFYRYYTTNARHQSELVAASGVTRVGLQDQVLDFPRQNVITRDNASVFLDAVLSYKVRDPRAMIYTVLNLQDVLSKLLQAQLRDVAGTLDIDQVIEESHQLNRLTGLLGQEAQRWGVQINFVKVQRVEAEELNDVLGKKKRADLRNQEIIINAKAHKQTAVIEAEGQREAIVRQAEGNSQQMVAQARGQAKAIENAANAEARSVKEIARVIAKAGENPAKYLLTIKYLEALSKVMSHSNMHANIMPSKTAFLQTVTDLGLNTIYARHARA